MVHSINSNQTETENCPASAFVTTSLEEPQKAVLMESSL